MGLVDVVLPFGTGAAAGLAVAMPLGPIGLLVVHRAARDGMAAGMAAGAGVAVADLCYALAAVVAGARLTAALAPVADGVRTASAGVLLVVGLVGLGRLVRAQRTARTTAVWASAVGVPPARSFAALLGLTLLNPLTAATFATLVLGLGAAALPHVGAKAAFVGGVGLASLGWQWLLAATGAAAGRRLPPGARTVTAIVGNLVVVGLAVRLGLGA